MPQTVVPFKLSVKSFHVAALFVIVLVYALLCRRWRWLAKIRTWYEGEQPEARKESVSGKVGNATWRSWRWKWRPEANNTSPSDEELELSAV